MSASEPVITVGPIATASSPTPPSPSPKVDIPLLPTEQTHYTIMPFKYAWHLHSGICQLLKMVIVGLFLFLPRLLIFLLSFFFLWLTSAMMLCCTDVKSLNAFPLRRPISRFLLRFWSRIILWCMGYWWIGVTRKPGSSGVGGVKPASIITPNHVSFVDAFYFAYAECPMAVAKGELAKVPIIGTITRATQTVYVKRESSKGKNVADIINSRTRWPIEQPTDVIQEHGVWPPLLIFPEATCTNAKSIIQFKAGGFYPMMPVQPVCLDYSQNSRLDVSWVGGMSPPVTLLRMMCQVYNKLDVTYLPIEHPNFVTLLTAPPPVNSAATLLGPETGGDYGSTNYPSLLGISSGAGQQNQSTNPEDDNPYRFAERVRSKIAAHLGVPLTNHNFLDVLLLRECKVLKLPLTAANVEMGAYPSGLEEAKKQLREFKKLDTDGTGTLDKKEFATFLGFEPENAAGGVSPREADERHVGDSMVEALLAKWDVDGDGKINFREFLFFGAMLKARHLARTAMYKQQEQRKKLQAAGAGGDPEVEANGIGFAPPDTSDSSSSLMSCAGREKQELLHAFALCFDAFDKDQDGQVKRGQFIQQVNRINSDVLNKEVGDLFDRIDTDKDGIVTLEEYLVFCEAQPVVVMTFLDALAVSDAELLSSDERSQTYSGELTRENSFIRRE